MKRIEQFNGLGDIFNDFFDGDIRTKEYFQNLIKETHNEYLRCEVFDIDQECWDDNKIRESLAKVEFLQNTIEQYIKNTEYRIDFSNKIYCGIGLVYELCGRILAVVKNKLSIEENDENGKIWYHIQKSLLYNAFMTIVFYACGGETAMSQIIAIDFLKRNGNLDISLKETLEYNFIKYFELENHHTLYNDKELHQDFTDIFFEKYGLISRYISRCLNVFGELLMKKYIYKQNLGLQSKMKIFFKTVRFLFPGQRDVLDKLDSSQKNSNIVSLQTGGGKSLVAEIYICKTIYKYPEKQIVYIAPTVALCQQIEKDLLNRFNPEGSDWLDKILAGFDDIEDEIDIQNNIYIFTPEKFLLVISRDKSFLERISLIVFDEFHNIGNDDGRAINMQIVINLIKQYQKGESDLKLLLISGIAGNVDQLSGWINGESCKSELSISRKEIIQNCQYKKEKEGKVIKINKTIIARDILDDKQTKSFLEEERFSDKYIKLKYPEKIAIFNAKKRGKAGIPKQIEKLCNKNIFEFDFDKNELKKINELVEYSKEIGISNEEIVGLQKGIGFYYKGMDPILGELIISYYKSNILKAIVCNSTLLEGVNLDIEYLFCYDLYYNCSDFVETKSLLNLIGRCGRFQYQTDGYILFHNTDNKQFYRFITPLFDSSSVNHIERGSNYGNSFESEFEVFFINRLSIIKLYGVEDIIGLSDEDVDELKLEFKTIIGEFFLDSTSLQIEDKINRLINYFVNSGNFIKHCKHLIDLRYNQTGMNSADTKIVLTVYEGLKEYWKDGNKGYAAGVFSSLFPDDIIKDINEISFFKKGSVDAIDKIRNSEIKIEDQFFNYYLPRILGCFFHFLKQEEGDYKEIIENIEYHIYRFKYGSKTISGYKLLKKTKSLKLTAKICEELVEKGCNGTESMSEIDIYLKDNKIFQMINSMKNYSP